MRENYRKSIASSLKLPQFTTMHVIDGQAGLIICASLIFYSLTIDNILNIIVMLILAAISITMLTGDNAILNRATNARAQTIHANVYEQLQIEALAYLTDKTTSKTSSTLIEYLQSKSIIENEIGENTGKYQINVTALLGSKQSLGNGDATVELKDVYMIEKQSEPTTSSIVNTKVATTVPIRIAATTASQVTYKVQYYGNVTSENLTLGSLNDSNDSSSTPVAKTDESAKLTEYFSKGLDVITDEENQSFKNVEPIMDATDKLKVCGYVRDVVIIQYGESLYKVSFVNEPWSATATMLDIDLTKFGEQTIDGQKVLVTPSTPDYLIHVDYNGPSTYYKYNETTEETETFTGYYANDNGHSRYYDNSGALVPRATTGAE